ncbi:Hypothetical predicted protein [Mytilus galloprovincialis]|uniref:CCHC-type domain-containing protein n=1 Tax=Mytilus galloprovincialis TaxID=29158 RepID=A0A8B6G629_MYTGA|nr:Hypothetical predicted protein [Mytilus galloprovincialis]
MDTGLDSPDSGSHCKRVAAAKDKISEGIELVQERQKLIKLADSSELGWRVVQEYITNPIADDSEDEKRMNRAQSRAERKSKAEKAKKRPRPVPYNKDRSSEDKNSNYKPGRCFTCGNRGHWSDNCPQNKKSKISTFNLLPLNNDLLSSESKINNVSFEHKFIILPSVSITSKYDLHNKNVTTEQLSSDTVLYLPGTPVGRLKIRLDKWKLITDNQYILDIIENGYKIPFKTEPDRMHINNNKSSLDNKDFVSSEILNLLKKGCIKEVSTIPLIVNPLTVAFNKSSKPRLVLDCRHINPHLFKYRFKYEDCKVARELFKENDFIFSYDLKSAYHHLEIFKEHQQYLGFSWLFDNTVKYFVFAVLPFGISTGYLFKGFARSG